MFKNCIFESTSLQDAEFENCNLINCQIKNCNLTRADTKQLWTPSHLRPGQIKRYLETGAIGKQGSVCPPGTMPPPKTT